MSRRCLGSRIGDYVAGELDTIAQLDAERHLVACQLCRGEVDLERRVRDTLRAAPIMPTELLASLMSLSQEIPVQQPVARPSRSRGTPGRPFSRVPGVPAAPDGLATTDGLAVAGVGPVPWGAGNSHPRVLGPQSPAQHRSALRATAFATAAAGASVVALWAFSVSPAAGPVRPAAAVPRDSGAVLGTVQTSTVHRTTMVMIRSGAQGGPGPAQSTP